MMHDDLETIESIGIVNFDQKVRMFISNMLIFNLREMNIILPCFLNEET